MKIYLTGLPEQAEAERLKEKMSHFGPVAGVRMLSEETGSNPIWIVDMDVDAGTATEIALRVDNIWFQGRFIRAHVPPFQD